MIKFLDLHKINARFETQFQEKLKMLLDSGHYILGREVETFETNFAKYCNKKHCIGVSNGLDALTLIFRGYMELGKLHPNDEVIVPANTYIASILAVVNAGLKPVLVEPDEKTFNISVNEVEKHISSKTKAVMPVHLYGQLADMEGINSLADKHNLIVVEDSAQAHGAINHKSSIANRQSQTGYSFYPTKNLGALGDAGAVVTNDDALAEVVRKLCNYGSPRKNEFEFKGFNNRMDEIQAGFLNVKLPYLNADNEARRKIAKYYLSGINNKKVQLPFYNGSKNHVFHQFVVCVEEREQFRQHLKKQGAETMVHYPIPPHRQNALKEFMFLHLPLTELMHEQVVSLPISPLMPKSDVYNVIESVNSF